MEGRRNEKKEWALWLKQGTFELFVQAYLTHTARQVSILITAFFSFAHAYRSLTIFDVLGVDILSPKKQFKRKVHCTYSMHWPTNVCKIQMMKKNGRVRHSFLLHFINVYKHRFLAYAAKTSLALARYEQFQCYFQYQMNLLLLISQNFIASGKMGMCWIQKLFVHLLKAGKCAHLYNVYMEQRMRGSDAKFA